MSEHASPLFKGRTYDILKYTAQIGLPALGTLYFALAQIWNLGGGPEIVGTIAAINVFIGVLVGVSQVQYNKGPAKYGGVIDVVTDPATESKVYSLQLFTDPEEIDQQKDVTFKVNKE